MATHQKKPDASRKTDSLKTISPHLSFRYEMAAAELSVSLQYLLGSAIILCSDTAFLPTSDGIKEVDYSSVSTMRAALYLNRLFRYPEVPHAV